MPNVVCYIPAQLWRDYVALTGKDASNVRKIVRLWCQQEVDKAKEEGK